MKKLNQLKISYFSWTNQKTNVSGQMATPKFREREREMYAVSHSLLGAEATRTIN